MTRRCLRGLLVAVVLATTLSATTSAPAAPGPPCGLISPCNGVSSGGGGANIPFPWLGYLAINPSQGPAGTLVEISGYCGQYTVLGFGPSPVDPQGNGYWGWAVLDEWVRRPDNSQASFGVSQPAKAPNLLFPPNEPYASSVQIPFAAKVGEKWTIEVLCDQPNAAKPTKVPRFKQTFTVTKGLIPNWWFGVGDAFNDYYSTSDKLFSAAVTSIGGLGAPVLASPPPAPPPKKRTAPTNPPAQTTTTEPLTTTTPPICRSPSSGQIVPCP